ncbi:MAG: hypothetical protein RLZZ364_1169 [Actinomycetota bacterium]
MVNLTRIYTKTGDDGTTALGDMSRTSKNDPRLEAYATVDEANSAIYTLYNRKTANKASDDSLCVKPLADGWKNLMGESNRIFSS